MIHIKDIVKSTPIGIKRQALSVEHIKNFLSANSQSSQELLNVFVWMGNVFGKIWPSQEYIGLKLGIARQTVNRLLRTLKQAGFIKSIYRHRKTCIYQIDPIFYHPVVRKELTPLLSNLGMTTLITLVMAAQIMGMEKSMSSTGTVTPTKSNIKIEDLERDRETYDSKRSPDSRSTRSSLYKSDIKTRKELWVKHPKTGKDICLPLSADLFPINGIDLTVWALINLTVFPDKVIKHAKDVFKTIDRKEVSDPYRWLFTNCVAYCLREDIEPDYGLANRLSMQHDMPHNAPMIRKRTYHPASEYTPTTPPQSRRHVPPTRSPTHPVLPRPEGPSSADKTKTVAAHNRWLTLDQSVRQHSARLAALTAEVAPERKNKWATDFPVPDFIKQNTGDHHEAKEKD